MNKTKTLSNKQIQELSKLSEDFENIVLYANSIADDIKSSPTAFLDLLTPPYYWSTFYDRPLVTLTGQLNIVIEFYTLFKHDDLSSRTVQKRKADARKRNIKEKHLDKFGRIEQKYIFGLTMAVINSLESIARYCKPIDVLIQEMKDGCDQSLFKAISIDRTVVTNPIVADRIAFAEYCDDTLFFRGICGSFENTSYGEKSKSKHSKGRGLSFRNPDSQLDKLRFLLYHLAEEGLLETLTQKSALVLFVDTLRVYSNDDAGTLWKNIRDWKKKSGYSQGSIPTPSESSI